MMEDSHALVSIILLPSCERVNEGSHVRLVHPVAADAGSRSLARSLAQGNWVAHAVHSALLQQQRLQGKTRKRSGE